MMNINKNIKDLYVLGYSAYEKLRNCDKHDTITIVFTKGKLEIETKDIERINVYNDSMNIFFKDMSSKYINLQNVTYME